ncbi:MAG: DNA-binding response regulator [Sulfurimonas sp.]|nr:MAG: DNA-binding response regulator [Sulfurimonas sp.]
MRILLMEDDAVLSDILVDYLSEFWDVDYAFNSDNVYQKLEKNKYDLFIFDINVTGKNGLDLLKELREFHNTTPTIMITAYTDTTYLKKAFELGAHDYIKKPFELEEINARIQNTQKLFNIDRNNKLQITNNIFFFPQLKEVSIYDKKIFLSTKDSEILTYLMNNRNRVITNEELVQNIWDFNSMPSDATIRSHIRTLREIIGKNKIYTIRSQGYRYE